MVGYKHSHIINILQNMGKLSIFLVVPVLRGLLFTGVGFSEWVSGVWFDLLIIFCMVGFGFVRWYFNSYQITNDGINVRRGILFKKQRFISYKHLSTMSTHTPFYFKPINVVRLYADSDAGKRKRHDFSLTIKKSDAEELIRLAGEQFAKSSKLRREYNPKRGYVTILSIITSNSIGGVLFFSALLSQLGNVMDNELSNKLVDELTNITKVLAFGVPPVAAVLTYVILAGWVISFVINLLRHYDFSVLRQGNLLDISMGIVTKRRYKVATGQINLVEAKQNLLTKVLGFFSVFIHTSGYGKKKHEHSVLIPAADKFQAERNLSILLPEIAMGSLSVKPKKKAIMVFLSLPIAIIIGIAGIFLFAYWLFPNFNDVIMFLGIMAEIPAIWFLFVKIASFFHTGIGKQNNVYTLAFTRVFLFYTVAMPKKSVSKIVLKQNLFQKKSKLCDVIIYSYSEGGKHQKISGVELQQAKEMFKLPE